MSQIHHSKSSPGNYKYAVAVNVNNNQPVQTSQPGLAGTLGTSIGEFTALTEPVVYLFPNQADPNLATYNYQVTITADGEFVVPETGLYQVNLSIIGRIADTAGVNNASVIIFLLYVPVGQVDAIFLDRMAPINTVEAADGFLYFNDHLALNAQLTAGDMLLVLALPNSEVVAPEISGLSRFGFQKISNLPSVMTKPVNRNKAARASSARLQKVKTHLKL